MDPGLLTSGLPKTTNLTFGCLFLTCFAASKYSYIPFSLISLSTNIKVTVRIWAGVYGYSSRSTPIPPSTSTLFALILYFSSRSTVSSLFRKTTVFSNGMEILRSEEHTSELQSRGHLVCRLLLEKKNYIASD